VCKVQKKLEFYNRLADAGIVTAADVIVMIYDGRYPVEIERYFDVKKKKTLSRVESR
jgi:hypothetical protein